MNELLLVILLCLTTYRVTRLIVSDYILEVPRLWLAHRIAPRGVDGTWPDSWRARLIYLFSCEWCMSIWVGAALVFGALVFVDVPYPFLTWAATSAVTGFLSAHENDEE